MQSTPVLNGERERDVIRRVVHAWRLPPPDEPSAPLYGCIPIPLRLFVPTAVAAAALRLDHSQNQSSACRSNLLRDRLPHRAKNVNNNSDTAAQTNDAILYRR